MGINIGEHLGVVSMVDVTTDGLSSHSFLRVRISLNITKPLKRFAEVTFTEVNKKYSINILYEKLPRICYVCGRLNHLMEDCHLFTSSTASNELLYDYGEWMCAPDFKRKIIPNRAWTVTDDLKEEITRKRKFDDVEFKFDVSDNTEWIDRGKGLSNEASSSMGKWSTKESKKKRVGQSGYMAGTSSKHGGQTSQRGRGSSAKLLNRSGNGQGRGTVIQSGTPAVSMNATKSTTAVQVKGKGPADMCKPGYGRGLDIQPVSSCNSIQHSANSAALPTNINGSVEVSSPFQGIGTATQQVSQQRKMMPATSQTNVAREGNGPSYGVMIGGTVVSIPETPIAGAQDGNSRPVTMEVSNIQVLPPLAAQQMQKHLVTVESDGGGLVPLQVPFNLSTNNNSTDDKVKLSYAAVAAGLNLPAANSNITQLMASTEMTSADNMQITMVNQRYQSPSPSKRPSQGTSPPPSNKKMRTGNVEETVPMKQVKAELAVVPARKNQ